MKAALGYVDPPMAPSIFVKKGKGGNGNGRNWPLSCFLAAVSSITGNIEPNPSCEGLVGLFNEESFFDIVSCSIPTNGVTC